MIRYSYRRTGMQVYFDVAFHSDGEVYHGRFRQRGHGCLAGIVSILAFGLALAGLVWSAMALCELLRMAHPFDMDRRSLWIVGISMITVAMFSFYAGAVAGKFVDPQRFKMSFPGHDDLDFEVVSRAATSMGVTRYSVFDHRGSWIGELLQQLYTGRIQLMVAVEPCVVVTFPDDTPTPSDLQTTSKNRPGFWPAVRGALLVFVLMPIMMLAPIWISSTRPLPTDAKRRRIWMPDPNDSSTLVPVGDLSLETYKTYLHAAELNIEPPGDRQHKLIAAAIAILFEGVLIKPEA